MIAYTRLLWALRGYPLSTKESSSKDGTVRIACRWRAAKGRATVKRDGADPPPPRMRRSCTEARPGNTGTQEKECQFVVIIRLHRAHAFRPGKCARKACTDNQLLCPGLGWWMADECAPKHTCHEESHVQDFLDDMVHTRHGGSLFLRLAEDKIATRACEGETGTQMKAIVSCQDANGQSIRGPPRRTEAPRRRLLQMLDNTTNISMG